MAFVHASCLKHWIIAKTAEWEPSTTSKLECELCHKEVPFRFQKTKYCSQPQKKSCAGVFLRLLIAVGSLLSAIGMPFYGYQKYVDNQDTDRKGEGIGIFIGTLVWGICSLIMFGWAVSSLIYRYFL